MPYIIKVVLTAVIVVAASELGKRSVWAAAILVSLPLTSILALSWLHVETGNPKAVSDMSWGIFWMVIPSLAFFVFLPLALKRGLGYWSSLALASFLTFLVYSVYVWVLRKAGIGSIS